MIIVPQEHRFLFDLQGYLLLRDVLDEDDCDEYYRAVLGLENSFLVDRPRPTTLQTNNTLPQLATMLSSLLDHPRVIPYLNSFVSEDPQLVHAWAISKIPGPNAEHFGWHRNRRPRDYSCINGEIRCTMLNVIYMLTDNGPDDAEMLVLPGSHKANYELEWQSYPRDSMPGAVQVPGKKGDVLLLCESVLHGGMPKTKPGHRMNLHFNFVHETFNIAMNWPENVRDAHITKPIRLGFTRRQQKMLRWMDFARLD